MSKDKFKSNSISTRAIHGNRFNAFTGPVTFPIYQTSTYRFENSELPIKYFEGDESVYVYSRYHNPTIKEVEEKIAFMEGGDSALLFASGMAAISNTILSLCKSEDEIVCTPTLYGGTYRLFRDVLPAYRFVIKYFNPQSLEDLLYIITPKTKIVYFESPTNPTLDLVDIRKLVKISRKLEREFGTKIYIIIDNTFATILNQDPFAYGVDLIIESITKYIGGHADILGGVIIGERKSIKKIKKTSVLLGNCAEPFTAFLIERSLKTFELRIKRQNENALALAKELSKHKNVTRVIYPGLPSHRQYKLAKKQMKGFGGIITIEVKGGVKSAKIVCNNLKVAINAMSLGGVETLVSIPIYSSHINMSKQELATLGVTPNMIRISVGVEGIEDLINDFKQALNKI